MENMDARMNDLSVSLLKWAKPELAWSVGARVQAAEEGGCG